MTLVRVGTPLRTAIRSALLAALLAAPLPLRAQSAAAPPLVLECAPCHGFDGIGQDDGIPNLGGQHRVYRERQLLAFRSGARRHPQMNFFARQMSQDELVAILDYYAGLVRPWRSMLSAPRSRAISFDLDQCVQAVGAG